MRRNILTGFTLCLGVLVAVTVGSAIANEKKPKPHLLAFRGSRQSREYSRVATVLNLRNNPIPANWIDQSEYVHANQR